jgi:predicted NUDIX family NTP pyrophosphohydrolase
MSRSAGLLLFRRRRSGLEVLLAHPGGPFWSRRDAGAWTIPKGEIEPDEDPLAAACREFEEETGFRPQGPFLPLGEVRQKGGKVIAAWAWEGDVDASRATSHLIVIEWPPRSGRQVEVPEADRCEWFDLAAARRKVNPAQAALLDRLEQQAGDHQDGSPA